MSAEQARAGSDEDERVARHDEGAAEALRQRLAGGDPAAIEERLAQLLQRQRALDAEFERLLDAATRARRLDLVREIGGYLRPVPES